MGHGKKPLDFGGDPAHVTLGLRLGWGHRNTPRGRIRVTRSLFNSNNFATSAALTELCALLSVILVCFQIPRPAPDFSCSVLICNGSQNDPTHCSLFHFLCWMTMRPAVFGNNDKSHFRNIIKACFYVTKMWSETVGRLSKIKTLKWQMAISMWHHIIFRICIAPITKKNIGDNS